MKPDNTLYAGTRAGGRDAWGARSGGDVAVTVDGVPLDFRPSLKLWNHSPTGFEWGYGGSGPAQLALAILLDFTGAPTLASVLHQPFKWAFVSRWPSEGWVINGRVIREWLAGQGVGLGSDCAWKSRG